MKRGLVFTTLACALTLGLASCNKPVETHEVSIENKEALQATWRLGDEERSVTVKIPGVIVADALADGDLVVTSSNADVVSVNGLKITAQKVGTSTISAVYKNNEEWSDSVEVSVGEAQVTKIVLQPTVGQTYPLGMKASSGMLYAQQGMDGYYIKSTNKVDEAAAAKLVNAATPDGDYKYNIVIGEKTVGTCVTGTGDNAHNNIGFFEDATTEYPYAKAAWKLEADGSFTTKLADKIFWLGTYGTYKTFSIRDDTQIKYKAHFYAVGDPVHATAVAITGAAAGLTLEAGKDANLTVVPTPADCTDELSFASSNADVAYVDQEGRVIALKEGTATITATLGGVNGTIAVTVSGGTEVKFGTLEAPLTAKEAKATLDVFKANVVSSKPLFVKGYVVSSGAEDNEKGTRRVDLQDGFVLYNTYVESSLNLGKGANDLLGYELVATGYGELYGSTYELTNANNTNPNVVAATKITTTSITLKKNAATLYAGKSVELVPVYKPDGAFEALSWESSDTAVATVENGVVTAVAVGTATITATATGFDPITATITVKAIPAGHVLVELDFAKYAKDEKVSSGTKVSEIKLDDHITATAIGTSNTGKIYIGNDGTTEWRFYKSESGTLKIAAASGYELVEVFAGVSGSNYGNPTDTELTINNGEVSFNNNNANFNIKSISVLYRVVNA